MCSSGPQGEAIVFPDNVSASGRLTRRWAARELGSFRALRGHVVHASVHRGVGRLGSAFAVARAVSQAGTAFAGQGR